MVLHRSVFSASGLWRSRVCHFSFHFNKNNSTRYHNTHHKYITVHALRSDKTLFESHPLSTILPHTWINVILTLLLHTCSQVRQQHSVECCPSQLTYFVNADKSHIWQNKSLFVPKKHSDFPHLGSTFCFLLTCTLVSVVIKGETPPGC